LRERPFPPKIALFVKGFPETILLVGNKMTPQIYFTIGIVPDPLPFVLAVPVTARFFDPPIRIADFPSPVQLAILIVASDPGLTAGMRELPLSLSESVEEATLPRH
jgi:hypothetical protein